MDISFQRIIDLTLPITKHMSVPPANQKSMPPVDFQLYKTHEKNRIQVGFYSSGIHAGTHLDAPLHLIEGGKTIAELDLNYFIGDAYCIDCSSVRPNEPVTAEMLDHAKNELKEGMIVFLYTGWSDRWFGTDKYWADSPFLGEDAAQWLVDHKVKMAGFDFFQEVAAKNPNFNADDFKVHKILLGNGTLNIEHVTNLGELVEQHFYSVAFPLKIVGAEGAAGRVVALK